MTSLTSLIERIEAATEGSRELDVAIALAMGWKRGHVVDAQGWRDWISPSSQYQVALPKWSTSIDAALTLLPNDWRCGFEHAGVADSDQRPLAWCWPFGSSWEPDWQLGYDSYKSHDRGTQATGSTAPLALLAAILRARQTEARG